MAQAKAGDTVRVHYTGRLDDESVFDTSEGHPPLEFTLGAGQVIPGFEEAVIGMEPGEEKTTRIPANDAYGERREELLASIPREHLPKGLDPEPGERLHVAQPDGNPIVVRVTEVSDETITIDGNHPLAGEALTFDVRLVEIV